MEPDDSTVNANLPSQNWRDGIRWSPSLPLSAPIGRYPGLRPGTERLKQGSQYVSGGRPLDTDLEWRRDVGVTLRDGTKIYLDVFLPDGATGPLPTIVAWSPYGKTDGGNQQLDKFPFRAGVAKDSLSGLQKWEGPDPDWWCARGYAIVHVDIRGAYSSEGRMAIWGTQDGRDGYDVVEWIAAQSWSNGKVGFAGNSWLAVSQWFIAAERPPHLAAIAPWEGFCDTFSHSFQGGVVDPAFFNWVFGRLVGINEHEDMGAMALQEPWLSPYWKDKAAPVEQIDVPAYVVASWTNPVHIGTFKAWQRLGSRDKWLRVHNTQEWPDFYTPVYQNDLLRFFDRYLKGLNNGWESTPPVRISVLGQEGRDEVDRPMPDFPPRAISHRALYLDGANKALSEQSPSGASAIRCDGPRDSITFDLPIEHDSELIGFSSLRLWVQLHEGTDQDVHVALERLDSRGRRIAMRAFRAPNRLIDWGLRLVHRTGRLLPLDLIFPSRVKGQLRLSHRELDTQASRREQPVQLHQREVPMTPGEIVAVDIPIDPVAWRLERGQTLRLRIAGHDLAPKAFPGLVRLPPRGTGRFSVWCGGAYGSHLWLPLVPAATSGSKR